MDSAALAEDSSSASVNGTADDTLSQVRNAALRLVSRAEQCTFLLTQKLLKKGFATETVKTVVFELSEANIVNDGRFSQMWLRSRIVSRVDTPHRITAALRAKGIARNTAAEAVQSCLDRETESALLVRFVKKRREYLPTEAADCRAALRGEGFSQEAVNGYFESKNFE
jgi:regulatory protein